MSIQIVEIAQPSVIDTVAVAQPSTVAVVEVRQGPAGVGGGGSATWGSITGTLSSQTDLQTALNLKAPLASPALTGTPTAPTAATTTNTTQLATTAFVQQELASGVAVAKNLEFLARNETGVTITKGSVVYVSGATGNKPLITLAQANNDANSAQTIGFAKEDIAHNGTGFVIVRGELENVKTFGATEGQQLYLSPTTAGSFTTTKPSAPDHLVYVGIVIAASTGSAFNGTILVAIQNGYELNELHDVAAQSPSAGQFLKRNAENTLWINSAIVSADISDATSSATPGTLALRDPDNGTIEVAAFIATDANNVSSFKGLSTLGSVTLAPDVSGDALTFSFLNYTYGTGAAAAHRTALGAGATGSTLFTAATPEAARTTLEILTSTVPTDSTATTQNVWVDSGASVNLTAGTWRIQAFYHGSNAGSSSTSVRLFVSANWVDTSGRRIASLTGASVFAGPTYQTGGTSSSANLGTAAPAGEIIAIVKMTGSGTLSMQMANTNATGTVTCFAGSHIVATKL